MQSWEGGCCDRKWRTLSRGNSKGQGAEAGKAAVRGGGGGRRVARSQVGRGGEQVGGDVGGVGRDQIWSLVRRPLLKDDR